MTPDNAAYGYDTTDACRCLIPWLEGAGQHSPGCPGVRCPSCGADVSAVGYHECEPPGADNGERGASASGAYECPRCGANDSTRCDFRISESTGSVVPSRQAAARHDGCRVMHYTDRAVSHAR